VKTSSDFVAVWNEIQYLHHVPSNKEAASFEDSPGVSNFMSSSSASNSSHQTSLSNESFPPAKKAKYNCDIDDEIEKQKLVC